MVDKHLRGPRFGTPPRLGTPPQRPLARRQPLTDPAVIPRTKNRWKAKKTIIGTRTERNAAPVRICLFPPRGSIRFVIWTVSTGFFAQEDLRDQEVVPRPQELEDRQ